MSDDGSTVTYGSNEFEVDLQQLSDAIGTVGASRDAISSAFDQIKTHFADVGAMWFGPAGQTFRDFSGTLASTAQDTINVLDDVVSRLSTAYQNYQDAETTNVGNLTVRAAMTPDGTGSGDGSGSGSGDGSNSDLQPASKPDARESGTAGTQPVAASMLTARQPSQ